jgi:UPF0755 protein
MLSRTIGRIFALLFTVIIFVSTIGAGFVLGFKYVISQNERFSNFDKETERITDETQGARMVIVPRGSNTSEIAELLYKTHIINNRFAFVFMSKLNGFDGQYRAGTHFVLADMSYDEIMYMLCLEPQTVRVTFREGLTYREVKTTLKECGVLFDEKILDGMMNNPALFLDYDAITRIPNTEEKDWILQGYLFPDTYEFDMNTDEESIIRTFLNNTQRKLIPELYQRAESLGMTMDEVITLASIIENESGRLDEMDLVASVFHNRLSAKNHITGKRLESCATINYIKKEMGIVPSLVVTAADQNLPGPYNTYRNAGLPAGPICSPGMDAIRAALWPAKTGYYYFVTKDDNTGSSAFAATQNEHINNVRKYLG